MTAFSSSLGTNAASGDLLLQTDPLRPALPSHTRRPVRVLVSEPLEDVARICLRALQHERLEVRHVNSAFGTWQILEEWRPQFFLIGDDFADCLGLELVGRLRAKTNAPILLLTATDSVGYLSNCLEAGADDVLVRPVLPPLLLAKTQAMLRRAYRYSVPPTPKIASAAPPASPTTSPAPVVPEVAPPASNFNSWPRCEACGYLGPRERFEGRDENNRPVIACPACYNSRIRFPIG